jgi:hypothetical protein
MKLRLPIRSCLPSVALALGCFMVGRVAATDTNTVRWWLTTADLGTRLAEQPALASA